MLCLAIHALATASHLGEHNVAVQTDVVPLGRVTIFHFIAKILLLVRGNNRTKPPLSELRLQQIDQKHQHQRDRDDERGTMEERMREWERKTEERLRKVYEDDLARFKSVEVAKMRLEERAKHTAEVRRK